MDNALGGTAPRRDRGRGSTTTCNHTLLLSFLSKRRPRSSPFGVRVRITRVSWWEVNDRTAQGQKGLRRSDVWRGIQMNHHLELASPDMFRDVLTSALQLCCPLVPLCPRTGYRTIQLQEPQPKAHFLLLQMVIYDKREMNMWRLIIRFIATHPYH